MRAACRYYGTGITEVKALDNANISVKAAEFVAIMGPSGSGKSTLLHLAGALDKPTSGSVKIAGTEITGLKAKALAQLRRRALGYVFQDFNLVPTLTALENVALPLELDGVSTKIATE